MSYWQLEPDPTSGDTFKTFEDVIAYLKACEHLPPTVIWECENEDVMEPVYLWLHGVLYGGLYEVDFSGEKEEQ